VALLGIRILEITQEGSMQRLSEEEKAAYKAFMRVVFAVPRVVTADMTAAGDLGLSDHVVLGTLRDAPDRRMRMRDLAEASGVSVSGVTRIMIRLDRAGLTARVRSEPDARGAVAVLTPAGAELFEQVSEIHLASVRRHILDQLGDIDLVALTSVFARIADSLLNGTSQRSLTR
jgi:DNA-binding MarR family transcriptional regulator